MTKYLHVFWVGIKWSRCLDSVGGIQTEIQLSVGIQIDAVSLFLMAMGRAEGLFLSYSGVH